jgi:GT2 family glycosyltransferase
MVYRHSALAAAAVAGAVFPEEFFAFWEDLDLGWRVSNAGWSVRYEPTAIAFHRRGATAAPGRGPLTLRRPPRLIACILANRWATLLRNLHAVDFARRLPVLLPVDVAMVSLVILLRPSVLPALLHEVPRLRLAWRQRRELSRLRLAELR